MDPQVRTLLSRLQADSGFADRYFANPGAVLAELQIPEPERAALATLNRDAVLYLGEAERVEPKLAPEHPTNNTGNRHMTVVIALWGCAAFVVAWLLMRAT